MKTTKCFWWILISLLGLARCQPAYFSLRHRPMRRPQLPLDADPADGGRSRVGRQFFIRTFHPPKGNSHHTQPAAYTTPTTTTIFQKDTCQRLSNDQLIKVLRDEGIYNPMYMAVDFDSAAQQFPDLNSRQFKQEAEAYVCDEADCVEKTRLIRDIWRNHGRHIGEDPLPAVQRRPTGKRPTTRTRKPEFFANPVFWGSTEPPIAYSHAALLQQQNVPKSNGRPNRQSTPLGSLFDSDMASLASAFESQRHLTDRTKRQTEQVEQIVEQSDNPIEIIGTAYAVYCSEAGKEEETKLHSLCGQCRAVRQLPEDYFPRVLNEVICKDAECVSGHGKCVQKFMPFKVMRNVGSAYCPDWQAVTLTIRTCCDCLVSTDSFIYSRFVVK